MVSGFRHLAPRVVLSLLLVSQSLFVDAHDRSPLRARRDDVHRRILNEPRNVDIDGLAARELEERQVIGGLVGLITTAVGGVLTVVDTAVSQLGDVLVPGQPTTTRPPSTPSQTSNPNPPNPNPGNPGTTPGPSPTTQPTATNPGGQNPTTSPNGGNNGSQSSSPPSGGSNNSGTDDDDFTSREPLQNAVGSPNNGNGSSGTRFSTPPPITLTFLTTDENGQTTAIVSTSTPEPVPIDNTTESNGPNAKGPIIAGIVALIVVIVLLAVGVFIYRRRQRQPIVLTRDRPTSASSFGSVSDEWAHMGQRSSSMPLGASAATMGSGGNTPIIPPIRPPSAYRPKTNIARSPSTNTAALTVRTPTRESGSTFEFPPSEGYFPAHIGDYPEPGTYTPFAIPPSSENNSGRKAPSTDYYASADTTSSVANPTSPTSPSAERGFHAQFRLERKLASKDAPLNPFSDAAATRESLNSIVNMRPSAPSPLSGTFGPCHNPPPSSPFVTGTGEDARDMRESYVTARTVSTPRLSAPPPPRRGNGASRTSATSASTSTEDFYSATSHVPSDPQQVSSSDAHYITAPENPFADPQADDASIRASTVSAASIQYPQLLPQHTARASLVPTPPSATTVVFPQRSASVTHSIQSSVAHDPIRCQSPDEDDLFYRPIKEFPDPPVIPSQAYQALGTEQNPFNSQETVKDRR